MAARLVRGGRVGRDGRWRQIGQGKACSAPPATGRAHRPEGPRKVFLGRRGTDGKKGTVCKHTRAHGTLAPRPEWGAGRRPETGDLRISATPEHGRYRTAHRLPPGKSNLRPGRGRWPGGLSRMRAPVDGARAELEDADGPQSARPEARRRPLWVITPIKGVTTRENSTTICGPGARLHHPHGGQARRPKAEERLTAHGHGPGTCL